MQHCLYLQTWDLMRLCWYGFKGYIEEFFKLHPNYYILPLRANGSAIETVFIQLKHSSRGTLTGVTLWISQGPACYKTCHPWTTCYRTVS